MNDACIFPKFKTLDWSPLLDFPYIILFDGALSKDHIASVDSFAADSGIQVTHGVHAPIIAFRSGEDRTMFVMTVQTETL